MKTTFRKSLGILILGLVVITGSKGSKGQGLLVSNSKKNAEITATLESKSANFTVKLYPNPTAGNINLAIQDLPEGSINILIKDLSGRQLFAEQTEHSHKGNFYRHIDANSLPDGIYTVSVITPHGVFNKKWTKGI